MSVWAFIRWLLFVAYVSCFFAVPLSILWEIPGLLLGLAISLSFLFCVGFRGSTRIASRLNIKELSYAECPHIFAITHEYCRRLNIPVPKLGVIDSPSLNLAVFGFSYRSTYLVMTSGAMNTFSRDTLAALMGRQLSYVWYGDFFCEAWLSQFLDVLDSFIAPVRPRISSASPRFYPFGLFVRQFFLYPLCLFPSFILKSDKSSSELDIKSIQITQLSLPLTEGLRLIQAHSERIPYEAPFSTRHFFLLPPPPKDPLAKLFFGSIELNQRIRAIEQLR